MIHPLTANDVQSISKLAHAIWPVCYANILTPEQIANLLENIYSEENLLKEMESGHRFWAAYDGNVPVGYSSSYKENNIVWLKKLYVLPQQHGKGIGKKLSASATNAFAPAEEIRLLVNRKNLPAQNFYERTGFTCIKEIAVQMGSFNFIDLVYSKPYQVY